MKRPLPVLEVDLLIEHDGHHLKLRGSGMRFVAKFPTLLSLFHFLRNFWSFKQHVPREASLQVEWRQLRIRVKPDNDDQRP
jgi:hypothetical protein